MRHANIIRYSQEGELYLGGSTRNSRVNFPLLKFLLLIPPGGVVHYCLRLKDASTTRSPEILTLIGVTSVLMFGMFPNVLQGVRQRHGLVMSPLIAKQPAYLLQG